MSWLFNYRTQLKERLKRKPNVGRASSINCCQLEDRVLFSASPIDPALLGDNVDVTTDFLALSISVEDSEGDGRVDGPDVDMASVPDQQSDSVVSPTSELIQIDDLKSVSTEQSQTRELVFVDTAADDYEQLLDDLLSNADESRNLEVALLDTTRDGIEQISDVLGEYNDLEAVHIVSHGTDGTVKLGYTWLSASNVSTYAAQISGWQDALESKADLLFYGCDLAAGEDGRLLLNSLGVLSDCDVAASVDDTGKAELGGDWDLEYKTGSIQTSVAFSSAIQDSWSSLLAVINVNQTADVVNGNVTSVASLIASDGGDGISLREAILATNVEIGADDIILSVGTFTLTIGGVGEDLATTGDLDITDDLTITGAGVGATTIDGNSLDRVFDVISGTVSFSDISIRGGNTAGDGGGIQNQGVLTLVNMAVGGNTTTGKGAGLYNLGSATLSSVTISGNTSMADDGGGIFNDGTSFFGTNVTISGNSADRGGGFYQNNANPSTLQNATITNNTAASRAGGVEVRGGSLLTIRNTIIADNSAPTDPDLKGTLISLGSNLIGDSAGGGGYIGSDILDVAPTLGPLADNGGPTETHALLAGSRGVDEGSNLGAPATDQRGIARDATTDIGAYEFDSVNIVVVDTGSDVSDGDTSSISTLLSNKGPDGFVSFREAIEAANATPNGAAPDRIQFNIAGTGPHLISLGSALPTVSEAVLIDGWSEADFVGTPVVRIDGNGAGGSLDGLSFTSTSDGSTVRGLMITRFSRDGILVQSGADNITIAGNWIGTIGTGSTGVGNANTGINVQGANTIIGGTDVDDGNVITNHGNEGINLTGAGATGTIIQGNVIGLDPDGATGSGNADVGIALLSGSHNTIIGGTTAAKRNVISNNFEGIEINSNNNIVQGNYIGTDATGTLDRGNRSDDGVEIQSSATGNLVGGTSVGAANLIAFNSRDGVNVVSGTNNSVLGNQIHSNSNLGIDLGPNGVTTNDLGDGDLGANNLQNYPLITTAELSGTDLTFSGSLDTDGINTVYRIEFFGNVAGTQDATNGEGRVFLGTTTVTTDGSGNATFSNVTLSGISLGVGDFVTATATLIDDPAQVGTNDALAYGQTSEFAGNITIVAANTSPVIAGWYDNNWLFRKEILINAGQVAGDLTDFPVLVDFASDADLASFAQADADDILFTSADGTTKLSHEIEEFISATGELTAWAKTDVSGSVNTRLFMYYGNALATNQQDTANVWDAGFQGVWHLNNSPTGAAGEIQDSTANNNDGTTEGAMNAADLVDAKLGKGLDFDEVNDLIRVGDSASLDSTAAAATIEAWVWWDDAADGDHQIVMTSSNRFTTGAKDGYEWASQGDGDHFYYPYGGADPNYVLGPNPFTNQAWHHVAVTQDFVAKDVEIYVDGTPLSFGEDHPPTTWTVLADPADWLWGGNPDRATRYFDGVLDELRVSNVTRSQNWIQTTISNQDNPGTFYSLGGAETRQLMLTDINEDDTNPAGDTVAAILSSVGGDRITDVDSSDPEGIAVIGADETNGTWQYDAGSGWTALGPVTDSSAVLLDTNALIRFVPIADYNGTAGNITFRAWDQTNGNSSGDTSIDVSINGGTTAYSTAQETASITVTAVNDAPTATDDPGDFNSLVTSLSPVGYWRLSEIAGTTATDESGTSNGTYNGVTLAQAGVLFGDSNPAASFDGVDDYVEIAHDAAYLIDDGTVQLWFNVDTLGADHTLFSKDSSGFDTGGHLNIEVLASGQMQVRLQSASSSYFVISTASVTVGSWHHMAFSFGSNGMDLFLDGQLVDSNAYTGGLGATSGGAGNSEPLAIGAGTQTSGNGTVVPLTRYFDGLIDEVAMFNTQLDADTVQDLYASAFQHYTIDEDTSLNVSPGSGVLANDYDAEGDPLMVSLVSGPINSASFTLNADGSFNYIPVADFAGTDTFTYRANDGTVNSNVATVTITVSPVNDDPAITSTNSANVAENQTAVLTVVTADVDVPADTITYSLTGGADQAQFSINATTGDLTFSAAPDFEAPMDADANNVYEVQVTADDGNGGTDVQLISVTVTDVVEGNVAPTISLPGGSVNYTENDSATVIDGGATFSDPDSADFDTGTLTLDFTANGTANDRLEIRDQGAGVGNISLSGSNVRYDFGAGPVVIGTFSGGTSGSDPLVVTLNANSDDPSVEALMQNMTYRNVSDNPSTLSRSVQFVLTDGDGGTSNAESETINVTAQNDDPAITSASSVNVAENQTAVLAVTVTDVDLDSPTYSITGGADNGRFNINAATGVLTFAIAPDFESPTDADLNNVYEVEVMVDDGNGGIDIQTINATVTNVNEAPVISVPAPQTTNEDTALMFSGATGNAITVTDVDAGNNPVTISLAAINGTLTLGSTTGLTFGAGDGSADPVVTFGGTLTDINNALGGLQFDPDANYLGSASIQITVDDNGNVGAGGALVDLETINITIVPLNDIPVANADSFNVASESTLIVNSPGLLVNDVDIDGDPLIVNLVTGPANGTLTLAADGSFTYAPMASFSGTDTFVYTVSDGVALSSPSTVSILVIGPPPPNDDDTVTTHLTDDSVEDDGQDDATLILIQTELPTSERNDGNDDSRLVARRVHHQPTPNTPIRFDPVVTPEPVEVTLLASRWYPKITNEKYTSRIVSDNRSDGHSSSTLAMFDTGLLWNQLDSLVEDLENHDYFFELVVGTAVITTGTMSAGLVLWAARGSYFLTMLSTSLPAWALIDPIPVLDAAALKERAERRRIRRKDKSLADIVDDQEVSVLGHRTQDYAP